LYNKFANKINKESAMKIIITEEMRYREKMCKYALKHGKTAAARKYHTNRMFVYRQLEKYDGSVRSLALCSRRPKSHPKAHTPKELELIRKVYSRYKQDGLAEVYMQLKERGYSRSFGSMKKQIRKIPKKENKPQRKSYVKYIHERGTFPGEKVQIDIKYIPQTSIGFDSFGKRYYQITAIDEFTRKRVLAVVDEKSVTNTTEFLVNLEEKIGFKINTIQTDNGSEFVNNQEETKKKTIFEQFLQLKGIKHKRTRPYSPWQNGIVERSHRLDSVFYERQVFTSEEDIRKKVKRYNARYNNIRRALLEFRSPNEMLNHWEREKAS
jgi:transposase InsO family protein